MNQIPSKIYYLISTGEVLLITGEGEGSGSETTKEQDISVYPQLQNINTDNIDFIKLEYGTLVNTFNNVKSYSIDLSTKTLNCIYYTQDELNVMVQQSQEIENLNVRVSDISQYLQNQGSQSISDMENYIIQSELNKLSN